MVARTYSKRKPPGLMGVCTLERRRHHFDSRQQGSAEAEASVDAVGSAKQLLHLENVC